MAHLEARWQQSRHPHPDPGRAAGTGRGCGSPRHRGSCFRAGAAWERRTSRRPRCCVAVATSTSSIPGTAAGATRTYATGVARAQTLLGPWEKRRRPILRGGDGIRCPGHAGVTAPATARRSSRITPTCAAIRLDRQLFLGRLRFGVDGWPAVAHPKRVSRRLRESAFATAGWQWPAGPRPMFSTSGDGIVLRKGAVARQTGTTRFSANTAVPVADREARPGLAVTGLEGNAVGVELRGTRAVAWASVNGRRRITGRLRLPRRTPRCRSRADTAACGGGRQGDDGDPVPRPLARRWAPSAATALGERRPGGPDRGCTGSRRPLRLSGDPAALGELPELAGQHRDAPYTPLAREPPNLRAGARPGQVAHRLELGRRHAAEAAERACHVGPRLTAPRRPQCSRRGPPVLVRMSPPPSARRRPHRSGAAPELESFDRRAVAARGGEPRDTGRVWNGARLLQVCRTPRALRSIRGRSGTAPRRARRRAPPQPAPAARPASGART